MNFKKVLSIASVASLAVVGLASCGGKKVKKSNYTGDIVAAVDYNDRGYMTYGRGSKSYKGGTKYTTVDGRILTSGETLTPVWQDIASNNNITFKDGAPTGSDTKTVMANIITSDYVGNNNLDVQLLQITANSTFTDAVNAGAFVNLKEHINDMPNLKAWLKDHPSLAEQLTLNADTDLEGYYYTPYFDGLDQVECGFNMNIDIARALLDDNPTSVDYSYQDGELNNNVAAYVNGNFDTTAFKELKYTKAYIPSINQEIAVADANGKATKFTVKIDEGQDIITRMNNLTTKNGATFVQCLKTYIDDVYGSQIGEGKIWKNRSEIFTGVNAAYNADELIALFRCVKANPGYLTGDATAKMVPFFPRTAEGNRIASFLKLTQIWGQRINSGEQGGFWFNAEGKLVDGYAQEYSLYTLDLLRQLQEEGLFPESVKWMQDGAKLTADYRATTMTLGQGFMTYDYNNVAAFNADKYSTDAGNKCYNMVGVLPALAKWQFNTEDGTLATKNKIVGASSDNTYSYTRFTDDDRSLKDGGWAIVAKNVKDDEVLLKCLEIMDYLYTPEGSVQECFGYNDNASDEVKATGWVKGDNGKYIQQDKDGNYYVNLSKKFIDEQVAMTGGTWHDFMTMYWGGCLGIGNIRSNYLEAQLTGTRQIVATNKYTAAMAAGAMYLAKTSGSNFLKVVPTTTSLSTTESDAVNTSAKNLTNFWTISSNKDKTDWTGPCLVVVLSGWSTATPSSAAQVGAYFHDSNLSRGKYYALNMGVSYAAGDAYSFLGLDYAQYDD
jgi:putative aldouronate transport system substrate-binding protein